MLDEDWTRDHKSISFNLETFAKQDAAIHYVRRRYSMRARCGKSLLHVFSRKFHEDRYRYFLVEDIPTFYQKYLDMRCKDRTFYEIIIPDSLCHLYFDIEFDKQLNPDSFSQ